MQTFHALYREKKNNWLNIDMIWKQKLFIIFWTFSLVLRTADVCGESVLRRPSCWEGNYHGRHDGVLHPLPAGAWRMHRGRRRKQQPLCIMWEVLLYSDKRKQLLKMTLLVNEQNVSVMYTDTNAISLYLDLDIFQQDECFCFKFGMEVEYAKSSLKALVSLDLGDLSVASFCQNRSE